MTMEAAKLAKEKSRRGAGYNPGLHNFFNMAIRH